MVNKTLVEIVEQLKQQDEVYLLEVLNITAEELVDKFIDKVEDKLQTIIQELGLDPDYED